MHSIISNREEAVSSTFNKWLMSVREAKLLNVSGDTEKDEVSYKQF